MLAQIVSPVGTVCSFKEGSSNMDPKRDIEELSSSLQTCRPFAVSDSNPSKSSMAHDLPSSAILPCSLNSISLVEISEERDDEGNDPLNDNVHLCSPKRRARVAKSNQKNESQKAGKGLRKQATINEMLDSILSRVERKTRSCGCRPARSSVWGSFKISKYFENSASKVIKKVSKKSKRVSGARGSRKGKNNGVATGLEVSNGNTSPALGTFRFKLKLGKETGQTCLKDTIFVAENGPQIVEATSNETCKLPNFSGHNSNKEVLRAEDLEKVVMSSEPLDKCPNKDLEISVIGEKLGGLVADNHQVNPSPVDIEGPGVAVDNKLSDLGTSPDSEVINLIPETQIVLKEQEDLRDAHISSQKCVPPADILSPIVPPKSRKKGKRSNNNPPASDLNVQDRLDRSERCGQRENNGNGVDFSGASTVNLSRNTSTSDGSPAELLVSSKASDKGGIFPCKKKSKGRRNLKNSTPAQGNEIGNAAKSVGEKNVKYKAVCGEFARTIKDYHDTGYNSMDVSEIAKAGDENAAQEKFDVGAAHIDVPDQCILPRNAWVCCDECSKWRRIPAILADSINETNSRWTCKENGDKNFADCSIPQEKSNSEINAELDISDEEDGCRGGNNSKKSHSNPAGGEEQSSWKLIKSNMFLNRSRKSLTIDEIMVCHCKPPTNGKFGCGNGCLNRMLNIECVKGTCPCGERCSNQQFQKRKYGKLKLFRCGKKGYGLQIQEDIAEGQFLIEYVGEVLDMLAYEARQKDYASKGHKHFYFMTLNGGEVIDACAKGNLGRFINHSCDPNCRTEKWMVNGEVCVGLFALKDLKKGDEVTFDYNYVRVFGAAAKKCVCGSPQCRGYLGGDPRNSDIIVQGDSDDEFPEPVMVCDDGEAEDSLRNLISTTTPSDDAKASIDNAEQLLISEDKLEKVEAVVEHVEGVKELQIGDDKTKESANGAHHLEEICRDAGNDELAISVEVMENSAETLQPAIQKTIISSPEASALGAVKKKSVKNSRDNKQKHKSDKIGDTRSPMLSKLMKASRLSSSVKKGKSSSMSKPEKIVNKAHGLLDKPKKVTEESSTVEGTLNELLDDEGGISKRQDATKGYLKLLLLTAASGDSGSGEAIQSNRELSMILGAILKTQSRSVLVDIIDKNGLQMLHNMLKRCRKDFSRIPILRKLLRVLEFLATKEILTKDLINKDPSCEGVESFRESILSLTEHDDKQVHRIARSFRDKWIPWFMRRRLPLHSHRKDPQTRDPVNAPNLAIPVTVPVSVDIIENEVETRASNGKRKSRWDQPAEPNKEQKVEPGSSHMNATGKEERLETNAGDEVANMDDEDDDVPPGFTPPRNLSSCVNKDGDLPSKVEIGYPQAKFMNRSPVSYGIPMPIVHQLGFPETETLEDWCIAPGIPFQPYPPVPTYSRKRPNMRDQKGNHQPAMSRSDHNHPTTSGSIQGTNNRGHFQQGRGSRGAGRHSRQQNRNNLGLPPPWKKQRNNGGFMGNDPRNRMGGGPNGPQGWNNRGNDHRNRMGGGPNGPQGWDNMGNDPRNMMCEGPNGPQGWDNMGNDPRNRICGGPNGSQGWNHTEIDSHYFAHNPQQGPYY